jgi:hypothetical protein
MKARQAYAAELEAQKTGKADLIKVMKEGFGGKTVANFDMKTGSLLLHYLCCKVIRSRQSLRNDRRARNDYYFYQGLDKLNKEGDIGYVI